MLLSVKNICIDDFDYVLPKEYIAHYPLEERDGSRLLIYKDGFIKEDVFTQIADYLPDFSQIIFNNSRVMPARLLFNKPTGGIIEIFCLEPSTGSDMHICLQTTKATRWRCLVGGVKKWKEGMLVKDLKIKNQQVILEVEKINSEKGAYTIEFRWKNENITFAELLETAGVLPLPPYLNREAQPGDYERYQTIYADNKGSVAAPTAGLHFTEKVFKSLKEKKIETLFTTLHVGAGTFKPVNAPIIGEHDMHFEWAEISLQFIKQVLEKIASGNKIIVAGTTSMRVAESVYWLGAKINENNEIQMENLVVNQWEPYAKDYHLTTEDALQCLYNYMVKKKIETLHFKTGIMIAPGYRFRLADALITNFHFPKSTLLLLIAAFTGNDWRRIYDYALKNQFRFLSYGDSSLLWRNNG